VSAPTLAAPPLLSSDGKQLGRTEPRVWTPPLVTGPAGPCGCGCALTPATSYGYAVERFAAHVLELPLDPWERWVAIHGGELLPDGRPRFRKLLVIVARQNGKTHLLVVLSLFWLYVQAHPLILGTSTKLDYAKESWEKATALVRANPALLELQPATRNRGIRQANGEQELKTAQDCRYKIAPANSEGGRSLTLHRVILDELRQHHTYDAWDAIVPATNAVPDAQTWAITNQGDDRSVVLLDLQGEATAYIETGQGDARLGLFEYSSPRGSDPTDPAALAYANPNMGRRIDVEDLVADGRAAKLAGGDKLAGFLTEIMCIRVPKLDPAVDPEAWARCLDKGSLDDVRDRVALCVDLSTDGLHATLAAAAVLPDGRARVELVAAWDGVHAARDLAAALPGLVARVRPRALGWFPGGPAASLVADIPGVWIPRGVEATEIRGDTPGVCMALPQLADAGQLAHSSDPLLDTHVLGAERLWTGDRWRFTRRGAGHVDAAYAAAGAVHLARAMPKPRNVSRRAHSAP
jgi:hypothetical protein